MESRKSGGAVRVRVTSREEDDFRSQDRKERFWNIYRHAPPNGTVDVSANELEARLLKNFGSQLKQKLVDYFHESWSGRGHRHDFPGMSLQSAGPAIGNHVVALGRVLFEARIDRYGSLDFSVEIAGARQLASLFDNDLSLLLMFMRTYVPAAFEDATSIHSIPKGAFDFDVSASDELREVFATAPKKGALRLPDASREMVLWTIANGTLIPAVLLALIVCYVLFKGTVEERASLISAQQRVAEQQAAVLKESTQRLEQAHRLEDELIKRGMDSLPKQEPQPAPPVAASKKATP
jgi:hypothetical protein